MLIKATGVVGGEAVTVSFDVPDMKVSKDVPAGAVLARHNAMVFGALNALQAAANNQSGALTWISVEAPAPDLSDENQDGTF